MAAEPRNAASPPSGPELENQADPTRFHFPPEWVFFLPTKKCSCGSGGSVCRRGSGLPLSTWAKRVAPEEYEDLNPFQRINHFPGTWGIGRKVYPTQIVGRNHILFLQMRDLELFFRVCVAFMLVFQICSAVWVFIFRFSKVRL